MRLATRITLAMVILVACTSVGIGAWNYYYVATVSRPVYLDRLASHSRSLATALAAPATSARADLLAMSYAPAIQTIIEARKAGAHDTEMEWREGLAKLLAGHMSANDVYRQFRFIGIADDGLEIVRVERSGPDGAVRIVPEDELQPKGDRSYLQETIALPPGEIYVSEINLNQEFGEIEVPHVPVVRLAVPVFDGDEQPFGILIINVDMRPVFERLQRIQEFAIKLFVVNAAGDYLVHPDPTKVFGFDLGTRHQVQSEFPQIAGVLPAEGSRATAVDMPIAGMIGVASTAIQLAGGPWVRVIEVIPNESLMAAPNIIRRNSLLVGLIVIGIAVIISIIVARSLVRPITRITVAVEALATGDEAELPKSAPGEIGVLARTFEEMSDRVKERTRALETEIDQRRRTERMLEAYIDRIRLYTAIFESASDAIVSTTLEGIISAWNPAAERMFGYNAAEAIGNPINMIVAEDRQDEVREHVSIMASGVAVENRETVRIRKDGSPIDVMLTISPVQSSDGDVVGISGIIRDITERKRSEEMFRLAVESSPSGILMIDQSGSILLVNAEAERLFGYERSELLGQPIETLVPDRARSGHPDLRDEFFGNPHARRMGEGRDLYGKRKDGTEFPVEVGLNPAMSAQGPVVFAVIIDISERKKSEEAIARYTEELQRSNRELEHFAYVASHDLQEPLRMVASYTELLAQRYKGQLDEKADKFIHYAVDGAKRMKLLIDDLLTFSRVGTQGKPLVPTDANAVLKQVLTNLKTAIEEGGATITSDELPQVLADSVQLGQVFQNLIANAIKFRAPDRPPQVHISAREELGQWVFGVSDNGIGIESQYAERVFQMFQRLHERDKFEGSGVGLAVVRKIVDRHGGRIWFEPNSQADGLTGVTFYFTISQVTAGRSE